MRLHQSIKPVLILRLSLGFSYLYSGYDLFMHPTGWHWAVRPLPQFVQTIINEIGIDLYLRMQGVAELIIALLFLAWFLPKVALRLAAFLSALQMALILIFVGLSLDTFRDIPILGASFAVFLMTFQKHGSKPK